MSTITTSCPRALAASIASNTTAPGSDPASPRTKSAPERSAQRASCSAAAARNVSPAARSTERPSSFWRCQAIFPIVVVFPLPFTPVMRITVGCSVSGIVSPSTRAVSASSSRSRRDRPSPPSRSPLSASVSSRSTIFAVVGAPTSA